MRKCLEKRQRRRCDLVPGKQPSRSVNFDLCHCSCHCDNTGAANCDADSGKREPVNMSPVTSDVCLSPQVSSAALPSGSR